MPRPTKRLRRATPWRGGNASPFPPPAPAHPNRPPQAGRRSPRGGPLSWAGVRGGKAAFVGRPGQGGKPPRALTLIAGRSARCFCPTHPGRARSAPPGTPAGTRPAGPASWTNHHAHQATQAAGCLLTAEPGTLGLSARPGAGTRNAPGTLVRPGSSRPAVSSGPPMLSQETPPPQDMRRGGGACPPRPPAPHHAPAPPSAVPRPCFPRSPPRPRTCGGGMVRPAQVRKAVTMPPPPPAPCPKRHRATPGDTARGGCSRMGGVSLSAGVRFDPQPAPERGPGRPQPVTVSGLSTRPRDRRKGCLSAGFRLFFFKRELGVSRLKKKCFCDWK